MIESSTLGRRRLTTVNNKGVPLFKAVGLGGTVPYGEIGAGEQVTGVSGDDLPIVRIVDSEGALANSGSKSVLTRVRNTLLASLIASMGAPSIPIMANPPVITVTSSNSNQPSVNTVGYVYNGTSGGPAIANYVYYYLPQAQTPTTAALQLPAATIPVTSTKQFPSNSYTVSTAAVTLPISNGTIAVNDTYALAGSGTVYIGSAGNAITYTSIVGNVLQGCNCASPAVPGTFPSSSQVFNQTNQIYVGGAIGSETSANTVTYLYKDATHFYGCIGGTAAVGLGSTVRTACEPRQFASPYTFNLLNYATVWNFQNWTDNGSTSNTNDGTHLSYFSPCLPDQATTVGNGASLGFIAMSTDAPNIAVYGGGGGNWQLMVDGQLQNQNPIYPENNNMTLVNFGTRKMRKLIWMFGAGFSGFGFNAIDTVVPLDITSKSFTHAWQGDSIMQAQGLASGALGGVAAQFGLLTGAPAHTLDAIGGTGYAEVSFATAYSFLPNTTDSRRIAALAAAQADVVVLAAGINDGWPTAANGLSVATAIQTTLLAARANNPNAILFVTPGFIKATPVTADLARDAYMLNFMQTQMTGLWIYWSTMTGTWYNSSGASGQSGQALITGSGQVYNHVADGNADANVGNPATPTNDAVHPAHSNNVQVASLVAANATTIPVLTNAPAPGDQWPTPANAAASPNGTYNIWVNGQLVTYTGYSANGTYGGQFTGCSGNTLAIPANSIVQRAWGGQINQGIDYHGFRHASAFHDAVMAL
jgi:lysophospholipase L1-like esterase